MDTLYGYKGKLWKVVNDFQFTGETESLTLDAGEYLLICNGAQGGVTTFHPNINYGGSAYGVLNLQSPTDIFINVGGNGESRIDNVTRTMGGFNGGGNGGLGRSSSYATGAGGGGATDIRIGENSLHSRVIVAGGGGGSSSVENAAYLNYSAWGGGAIGGCLETATGTLYGRYYASQTGGYSFGNGMDALDKTNSSSLTDGDRGASGGGGGWYGGYATGETSLAYTSMSGGGGSGYVLTADSYKPEGYLLGEEYYLTDTFLNSGSAINPCAMICVPVSKYSAEDIIHFPCVGEIENIQLFGGIYKLKCYGGDGGVRAQLGLTQRGGYAEGILTLTSETDIFVNVGGCGVGPTIGGSSDLGTSGFYQVHLPTCMYNGGGAPSSENTAMGTPGGGATDIRIGSDSLYARVIVAGGAGGNSAYLGGLGGGTTGGSPTGNYGTNSGPGTQTESPQNETYPTINGGFGYGGNAVFANGGYGGAGGGGWFGGSGTYPDQSNDDDKGGAGGSGYVLTADSYKPEGYLLGEEYYLTDTILTSGGNNLPINHTEAVIEVVEAYVFKMLCIDKDGIKRFNEETSTWVYLAEVSSLTDEMIEEYGVYSFITDSGLNDKYEILFLDPDDEIGSVDMSVVPNEQKISTTIESKMNVSRTIIDGEYEAETFNVRSDIDRVGVGNDSTLTFNLYLHKLKESDEKLQIYCTQIFSK